MLIQLLENEVIAQIAAGEVVDRPASVVKELIENAIDAGAKNIHVAVREAGQRLIRISDDGCGIPADEIEVAFKRHATSKLRTAKDLERILTLGFRGEALYSIAAVSHVTVTTRYKDEVAGTRLKLEGGITQSHQSIGAPTGTIIAIEHLFYNTPARRKFLKSESTEKRIITAIITNYAMAYPDIRFTLEQDGREVFRSTGSGQLGDVLVKVFGLDNFKKMTSVELNHQGIVTRGYVSLPDLNRSDRTKITLFVNGRAVQDSRLTYSIVQAYHNLIPEGKYPIAVVMIELPAEDVDVNVHPTKAEVRFTDQEAVFTAVQRAIRSTLVQSKEQLLSSSRQTSGSGFGPVRQAWEDASNSDSSDGDDHGQMALNLQPRNGEGRTSPYSSHDSSPYDEDDLSSIPVGAGIPAKPRTLPIMRVVGQVGAMYIVAEGPAGLYLVDQHAAHETVLYEQILDTFKRAQMLNTQEIAPQTVEVTESIIKQVERNLKLLENFGFGIELFGRSTLMVRALPALLTRYDPVELIANLVREVDLKSKDLSHDLALWIAKNAAVRAGQILSVPEMQNIIRQLERCESPLICPSGTPTMLHMSGEQIAREFKRS